jgi:mRNA interferase RelE/StbE
VPYTIILKRSAERELDELSEEVFTRIADQIQELELDPRRQGSKKLRGSNSYRIRIGDYRVIYTIDDRLETVEIVAVGHRRDIYRGR